MIEVGFARFTQTLLTAESIHLSTALLATLYRTRAAELGFGWGAEKINRRALFAQVEDCFGSELLSKIDAAYRSGKTSGWFHVVGSSAAAEAPLYRHLLLAYFLFRDAGLFLERARSAVLDSKPDNLPASAPTQCPAEEDLLDELIKTAQRYGCNAQELWKHNFGAMKKLVKVMPTACEVIDAHLFTAEEKRKHDANVASERRAHEYQLDRQWAEAIRVASSALYQENHRPIRVTKCRLLKSTKFNARGKIGHIWPTQDRFPLAFAAAQACMESTWHFYARRLLWTILSLHDPNTPVHMIVTFAALEVYKIKAVLLHFSDIPRGGGASVALISSILNERGIKNDWEGPCPERSFYKTGRAYRLRTSRRGPIGGRAGDPIPTT